MTNELRMLTLADEDIRIQLRRHLVEVHKSTPNALITEEFGCDDARADIAVFTDVMHCFEIKSGRDNLDRLSSQIPAYSCVFDHVTLVTERKHISKARKIMPHWWGLMEAISEDGTVTLRQRRMPKKNTQRCKSKLVRMLWRDDAYSLLRIHAKHEGLSRAPVQKIWQAAEGLPLPEITRAVRNAVMRRGGSGFRPPLMQNGDSSPTVSSYQHFLGLIAEGQSLQFAHPPH